MEFAAINSPLTAFIAGLITSLHCAGMCGPLACSLMPVHGDRADAHYVATAYHLTRLTSYALLGAFAGALGRMPLLWATNSALQWLPWLVVLFFIASALRLDRHLPKPLAISRLTLRISSWSRRQPRTRAAAAMGFFTPLLPCGPLYFLIALAALSGSALRGVEFMLAFGLGTVPLLWLAQSQFHWVRAKLSPLWLNRVRLTLGLTTALVIGWRLRATFGFAGPDPSTLICF